MTDAYGPIATSSQIFKIAPSGKHRRGFILSRWGEHTRPSLDSDDVFKQGSPTNCQRRNRSDIAANALESKSDKVIPHNQFADLGGIT
jgi:hypothetical protein